MIRSEHGSLAWSSPDLSLPLTGDSRQYPDDWYRIRTNAQLVLPNSLSLFTFKIEKPNSSVIYFMLPLKVQAGSSPNMVGFDILADVVPQQNKTVAYMTMLVRRDDATRQYAWFTVGGLFLLAVALTVSLLASELPIGEALWQAITAIAAVTLAVVPLRSVIVPQNLAGPTRLDTVLSVLVSLLIGLIMSLVVNALIERIKESRKQNNADDWAT